MKRPAKPWWEKVQQARTGGNAEAGLRYGFRSGLEEKNAKLLEQAGQVVLYETFKLRYAVPLSFHTYTPDFRLANGIIVETKGVWEASDRKKMLLVKAQYPHLDIRMVFTNSRKPIAKGSATTYGMVCDANGIKYADKLIPQAWVTEPGPEFTPEEALLRGPVGYEEVFRAKGKTLVR